MSAYTVNTDGTAIGPDGIYMLWYWRHHSLYVDMHHSLRDALASFWYARDSGESAPESIEGPAGVVPADDLERWLDGYTKRDMARLAAEASRGEVWTYVLVQHPVTGQYAEVERFTDPADAHRLVERLGIPGRVLVRSGRYNEDIGKLAASAGGSTP